MLGKCLDHSKPVNEQQLDGNLITKGRAAEKYLIEAQLIYGQ